MADEENPKSGEPKEKEVHDEFSGSQETKYSSWGKEGEASYSQKKGYESHSSDVPAVEKERKVGYQHTWTDEDKHPYAGSTAKVEKKSELASGKAEVGTLYKEVKLTSGVSYDLDKKEVKLNLITAKVGGSIVHGSASGAFSISHFIAGLFSSDEEEAEKEKDPKESEKEPPLAVAGLMAARVTDSTTHGSPLIPGIGSTNVFIGGMPAWRAQVDFHACPIVKGLIPDVGGMVMMGSPTVFINNMMACRVGDMVVEIPGGPNPIVMGCPTVFIGGPVAGGGGGGGEKKAEEGPTGLVLSGKAEGDLFTGELEAKAVGQLDKDHATLEAKAGAMVAFAKGTIGTSLKIPLWGDHAITLGTSAEGTLLSLGAEGHIKGGWEREEGYKAEIGGKVGAGLGGVGLKFSVGLQ